MSIDKKRTTTKLLLLSFMIVFSEVAFSGELNISSATDVVARSVNDGSKSYIIKTNTETKVPITDPLWITGEHSIPILLVPVLGNSSAVKLDPPKISEVVKLQSDMQLNKNLSQILAQVSEIQSMLRKRQFSQSRIKLQQLMALYPNVSYLKFIQANQFLLEGERKEALRLAEEGLIQNPDYEEGKKFVAKLKGDLK